MATSRPTLGIARVQHAGSPGLRRQRPRRRQHLRREPMTARRQTGFLADRYLVDVPAWYLRSSWDVFLEGLWTSKVR
jgi:hypothetical protein